MLQEDVRGTSVRCNASFAAVVKHTTTNDKEERIRDLLTAVRKTRSLSGRADQAGNQHIARIDKSNFSAYSSEDKPCAVEENNGVVKVGPHR